MVAEGTMSKKISGQLCALGGKNDNNQQPRSAILMIGINWPPCWLLLWTQKGRRSINRPSFHQGRVVMDTFGILRKHGPRIAWKSCTTRGERTQLV